MLCQRKRKRELLYGSWSNIDGNATAVHPCCLFNVQPGQHQPPHLALTPCHLWFALAACRQRQALCAAHAHALLVLCSALGPETMCSSGIALQVAAQLSAMASGGPKGVVGTGIHQLCDLLTGSLSEVCTLHGTVPYHTRVVQLLQAGGLLEPSWRRKAATQHAQCRAPAC